jgi:flavodoxin
MKTAIIYSSLTGNTKLLAEKIYESSPGNTVLIDINSRFEQNEYEKIIFGFWVDRGSADKKTLSVIETISNKKIGFFATLGAYPDSEHAKKVIENVKKEFEKNNNEVSATFICQGKVSESLKEKMKSFPKEHPHYPDEARLKRWAEADLHPNENDFCNAKSIFELFIKGN